MYNRFKWDFDKSGWDYDVMIDEANELADLTPDVLEDLMKTQEKHTNSAVNRARFQKIYKASLKKGLLKESDSKEKKKNVILQEMKERSREYDVTSAGVKENQRKNRPFRLFRLKTGEEASALHFEEMSDNNTNTPYALMGDNNSNNSSGRSDTSQRKAAFLTVRVTNPRKGTISGLVSRGGEQWIRYYFVLQDHYLYYYSDRRSYELNPSKPLNVRPIDLEGYKLVINSSEPPLFSFSIIPLSPEDIRKTWKFRCDTLDELNSWIDLLEKTIPKP
jgi:hypothetical protein